MACALRARGFHFVGHRIRTPYAEVDLIFQTPDRHYDWLIEVKTLWINMDMDARVTSAQRKRLDAALQYWRNQRRKSCRAILAVVSQSGKINYIPDFLG